MVRESLASIRGQPALNLELIISDIASKDAAPEVLPEDPVPRQPRVAARPGATVGAGQPMPDEVPGGDGGYFAWTAAPARAVTRSAFTPSRRGNQAGEAINC